MEHLREFKEEVEIVEEPTPPTTDVLIRSRGRSKVSETGSMISASLGAMRALVGKLDMLLLGDAPQKCCSKRMKNSMRLLKDDVKKISSYLLEMYTWTCITLHSRLPMILGFGLISVIIFTSKLASGTGVLCCFI